VRENRAARSGPTTGVGTATQLGAANRQGGGPVVRDRVHQHGLVVHNELVEGDGEQSVKTTAIERRPTRAGQQQDHGQPTSGGWPGRPQPSGRAPDQPVEQRGRGQSRCDDGRGGGRGGGEQ